MTRPYDVVVVGGGITGAGTAYHLKKRGVGRVLLLERREPAAGGTGKSAAIVRQHYSTPIMARLARASVPMLASMHEELGQSGGYQRVGWAFLVPEPLVATARRNVEMQRSVGIATRFLSEGEIAERMPWLDVDGVAVVVFEDGGYADPVRSTEAYLFAFRALGGDVRLDTPCRGLSRTTDRVTGVVTDDGPIGAGVVVNAAGPWSPGVARSAGIALDVRALREQDTVWQAPSGRPLPSCSISNAVDAIYLPQGDGRYVIGRGVPKEYFDVDPDNYKETADEEFVAAVRERSWRRVPALVGATLLRSYAALYDVTPNWYPVIGPRSGLEGYVDACGGSGHGFKIAPAIGRELADWIVDGKAADDFAALSYDCVGAGKLFSHAYGGNRG